jgi:hypothetical protein
MGHVYEYENAEIFQPHMTSSLTHFMHENSAEACVLGLYFVWDSSLFRFWFIAEISSHQKRAASPKL